MAEINLVGINLNDGQFQPIGTNDASTDTQGNPVIGFSGLTGPTGLKGFAPSVQGEAGLTGARGVTGFSPTGMNGGTGIFAVTGVTGRTGVRGVTGISNGVTGSTGLIGITGFDPGVPVSVLFGPTTITTSAYVIGVTGGGYAVTLPAFSAATRGKKYLLYDINGTAATTPWSISGAINGLSGYTVAQAFELVEIVGWSSSFWTRRLNRQGSTGVGGDAGIQGATGITAATGIQGATGL